jgi:hypothetical protein
MPSLRSFLRFSLTALLVAFVGACNDDDPTGPGVPAAPTNVAATSSAPTTATITFDAVTGATSYIVERAPGAGGTFVEVGAPTASPFVDTGLTASTAYRYRVAAVNAAGTSPYSSEVIATTPALGPAVATISSNITANRTLFSDTLYTLSGFIRVANGATLTIEPGTVIQGDFDVLGSSLFILRGAKIDAQGTAAEPIVFTSNRPVGSRQPGDWGGLILVGNGIINRAGDITLEGTNTGANNPTVLYSGGNNNADDSGTLRYVRVEFAGYAPVANAELNAFTFAAVGSGTELEYLQTLNGLDDSFEFFGGAVDGKHFVSYDSGDDHFDMSEGYVGRLQNLIAYQSRQVIPRTGAGSVSSDPQGIENDGCDAGASGCTNGNNTTPLNIPLVANFTLLGPADGVFSGTSGGIGMVLRRGTGGYYVNGVVARWERAGISMRDAATHARTASELVVSNIHIGDVGARFETGSGRDSSAVGIANITFTAAHTKDSLFAAIPNTPTDTAQIDWSPKAGAVIETGGTGAFAGDVATKAGTFASGTAYRGAVDPAGPEWWRGWTYYADN